jgi:hypothetical protein
VPKLRSALPGESRDALAARRPGHGAGLTRPVPAVVICGRCLGVLDPWDPRQLTPELQGPTRGRGGALVHVSQWSHWPVCPLPPRRRRKLDAELDQAREEQNRSSQGKL